MKGTVGAVIVTLVFMLARGRRLSDGGLPPAVRRDTIIAQVEIAPSSSNVVPPSYLHNPLLFLSTAPPDSLILLPGIGPVLAERIAGERTGKRSFTTWEDLLAVKGIGPKKLDRLRSLSE
jgi:predicted flap endonuclease-1-like 5' DNA nuclease